MYVRARTHTSHIPIGSVIAVTGLGLLAIVSPLPLTGSLCNREDCHPFCRLYLKPGCWEGGFLEVCVDSRVKSRDKGIPSDLLPELHTLMSTLLDCSGGFFICCPVWNQAGRMESQLKTFWKSYLRILLCLLVLFPLFLAQDAWKQTVSGWEAPTKWAKTNLGRNWRR